MTKAKKHLIFNGNFLNEQKTNLVCIIWHGLQKNRKKSLDVMNHLKKATALLSFILCKHFEGYYSFAFNSHYTFTNSLLDLMIRETNGTWKTVLLSEKANYFKKKHNYGKVIFDLGHYGRLFSLHQWNVCQKYAMLEFEQNIESHNTFSLAIV